MWKTGCMAHSGRIVIILGFIETASIGDEMSDGGGTVEGRLEAYRVLLARNERAQVRPNPMMGCQAEFRLESARRGRIHGN